MRQPSVIARRVAAASVSLVLAAGAAACGPEDNDARARRRLHAPQGRHAHGPEPQPAGRTSTRRGCTPPAAATSPSLVFRTLTTRNRENGAAGAEVVPDLATDTGRPSKDATVWTYTLKKGLKYEDGTRDHLAPTSSTASSAPSPPELSGGAPYLRDWLVGAADYQGPYKDKKGLDVDRDAGRADHRLPPEQARGRVPVPGHADAVHARPKAKDTGTKYEEHPVSSGPYKVVTNENDGEQARPGAQHALVRRRPTPSARPTRTRSTSRPGSTRPSSTSGCRRPRARTPPPSPPTPTSARPNSPR